MDWVGSRPSDFIDVGDRPWSIPSSLRSRGSSARDRDRAAGGRGLGAHGREGAPARGLHDARAGDGSGRESGRGQTRPVAAARRARASERAPSRRTPTRAPVSIAVRSTTVDGTPVSSPPSIARSTPRAIRGSRSSKRLGAGSPLRLALVWKIAHASAGERALDQPQPERARVLAAGERVAVLGVGDDQRHRARQQRRRRASGCAGRAPTRSSRIASGEKNMTAEGLPSSRPLMRVDALDRRRVAAGRRRGRRGRRPGTTATPPAAMQRSSARSGPSAAPSRSIETTIRRRPCDRAPRAVDARPGPARPRPARSPRLEHELGDRAGLTGADLERDRPPAERGRGRRRDAARSPRARRRPPPAPRAARTR